MKHPVQWFDSEQQNGFISPAKPLIEEIKTLRFLQLKKFEKTNHLCFRLSPVPYRKPEMFT